MFYIPRSNTNEICIYIFLLFLSSVCYNPVRSTSSHNRPGPLNPAYRLGLVFLNWWDKEINICICFILWLYLIECLKKHAVKSYQESQWSHFDDNNRVISLRKPIHLRLVFLSPSFLPWDVHVLLFSREWQHHIFPPDDPLDNEMYKIKIYISAYQLELIIWWN